MNALTHKHCWLMSSHGEVTFDASTGIVVKVREETDEPGALSNIYRVDVDRLRNYMPEFEELEAIDILDVGYWYVSSRGTAEYEDVCQEHLDWTLGRRDTPC
jgi:hypothetical protein